MRDIYAGGPVALYTVTVAGTTITKATHYLYRDHLGSVQSITDASGRVTTVYRYDPFGKQQLVTGSNTTTHHGYTGHEMHNGAGFIHMNGRTYDPSLGRFMQSDPTIPSATNLQAYNRYAYVLNNPLSFTDPSGFSPFWKKGWFKKNLPSIISVASAMLGVPGMGAVLNTFISASQGANIGSLVKGFAISYVAGVIAGGPAARLGRSLGLSGGDLGMALIRGGSSGGLAGGMNSVANGGQFGDGFRQGALTGMGTAAAIWGYNDYKTTQFIKNNVNCGGTCSKGMIQTFREAGQSPVGQRLMAGFRNSGSVLNIFTEGSSPYGSLLGPHVGSGTNNMYFDGNVQQTPIQTNSGITTFGAFVAGEPWGPSMNDATTFVHEFGHTLAGFTAGDPLNVNLSENPYRAWMGTPPRNDYAVLSQGQPSVPVP